MSRKVSARQAVVVTMGLCVALTVVVHAVDIVLHNRRFQVGLETADAIVLVFIAAVLLGRFRVDSSRRSLLMLTGVILLAVKNLLFAVATVGFDDELPGDHPLVWSTAVNGLLGASLLAAAALLPEQRARWSHRAPAVLAPGVVVAVVTSLLALAGADSLPHAFEGVPETIQDVPLLSSHPTKLLLNGLTVVAYCCAAFAFARLADRANDELMTYLGIGTAVAAVAFVNYVLVPSRFTGLFYGGEVLWIVAVIVLLYGAVREVAKVEAALVRTAVLDERKRVARDLHDGVAQELAFISSQTHWFLQRPDDVQPITQIMGAVERALDEARGAIASLNRPLDEPLVVALEQTALGVAERVGARLRVALDPAVAAGIDAERRDALLRIAREAVGNAVRHGHARTIELQLARGEGARAVLRIIDDGDGFDVDAVPSRQSFGLVGMRERTESLGGRFAVSSTPGTGTTVEVELP